VDGTCDYKNKTHWEWFELPDESVVVDDLAAVGAKEVED
jgi:hypothetical protein